MTPTCEEYDSRNVCIEDVECDRATDKAIHVYDADGFESWVPQSQIHEDSEVYSEGDAGRLIVSRWLAEQKGWV